MRMIKPPVSDYMEMAGWPGTIPVKRLRRALDTVRAGTHGGGKGREIPGGPWRTYTGSRWPTASTCFP